jgi:hypothetical protein
LLSMSMFFPFIYWCVYRDIWWYLHLYISYMYIYIYTYANRWWDEFISTTHRSCTRDTRCCRSIPQIGRGTVGCQEHSRHGALVLKAPRQIKIKTSVL